MTKEISYTLDLVSLLEKREEIIVAQSELISKLINENLEKENFINILVKECEMEV